MQELEIHVAEVRAQMGRANITQTRLAELAGVHKNTITKILQNKTADLESIAAIARGLNQVLREAGQAEINPIDLKAGRFSCPTDGSLGSLELPI